MADGSSGPSPAELGISSADLGVQNTLNLQKLSDEGTRVKALTQQLEDEFNADSGRAIKEALAGTLEDSSQFHLFVFNKTVSQPDAVARREMGLAHIALTLDNKEILRTESPYGDQVGKSGYLRRDIEPGLYHVEQMIPDHAELLKGHQGEKLVVSFEDIKDEFGKFTEHYLDMYKILEGRELQPNISREQMAAIMATQKVVMEYFGLVSEHSAGRNRAKYANENKQAKLADFKGNSSAVCTEYGALSQQLLSYAGIKVRLIAGGPMIQADENGEFDMPEFEGHVFIIIEGKSGTETSFIYDPANPVVIKNEYDPSTLAFKPYLAQMGSEDFRDFLKGDNTVVECAGISRMYARV